MNAAARKNNFVKLPRLREGATVGVLAISSAVEPERLRRGVSLLNQLGYPTKSPIDAGVSYGKPSKTFGCASAVERAAALAQLVADPEVGAIITARGGYGTIEVLPHIDFNLIKKHPKPIVGFSDVTVLLTTILEHCGIPAIHGPAVGVEFGAAVESEEAKESVDSLLSLLSDVNLKPSYKGRTLRAGQGEGKVIAGNLTMLCSILGTRWDFDYSGCILALEDINEMPYRLHRSLMQLKNSGKLDSLAGLVLGRFSGAETTVGPSVADLQELLVNDMLVDSDFPVVADLEFGHCGKNLSLPLGVNARLADNQLQLLESVVE